MARILVNPQYPAAKSSYVRFCTLIPTKGRADMMRKMFTKMPWLVSLDTILGIEVGERKAYAEALAPYWGKIQVEFYRNPTGSIAVAREYLRAGAMEQGFDYYVVTDDNAVHRSEEGLHNLVKATHACKDLYGPGPVAGFHNTAPHFDRGKIGKAVTLGNGLRVYPAVAMIFQCYPHSLYSEYRYPADAYGLDDRHFFLWCLSKGVTQYHVCMDAPYTKSRYQEGGQGSLDARAMKTGLAIARLATDFPKMVGAVGTLRIPWQFLIESISKGGQFRGTRLVGGAMRKEASLQSTGTVRLKVKVKRKSPTTER